MNGRALPWFLAKGLPLRGISDVLSACGIEVRLVGGFLRDHLMGFPTAASAAVDFDLAVDVDPDAVMRCLKSSARYRVYLTGLAHGTLTVLDSKTETSFEVTSLRVDKKTDGRHADVEFTNDWRLDATRRDFTFNALSMDFTGRVYDYVDGVKDLARRRIRFVGEPEQRIKEDYLRILRFFRFISTRARSYEARDLAAAYALKSGLAKLAKERIGHEMRLLLLGPRRWQALDLMDRGGVLADILPSCSLPVPDKIARAQRLSSHSKAFRNNDYSGLLCLALLLDGVKAPDKLASDALRLSRKETGVLATLLDKQEHDLRRLLHRCKDRDLLALIQHKLFIDGRLDGAGHSRALRAIANYVPKRFPVTGDMVKGEFAVKSDIGRLLRKAEDWWIDKGRRPGVKSCLAYLRKQAGAR